MGGAPQLLEHCAVSRCRRDEAMRYEGKPLCMECFSRFTEGRDDSDELRRALRIPLPRRSGEHGARNPRELVARGTNPDPVSASPQSALAGSIAE